jgi:hypothetical protein
VCKFRSRLGYIGKVGDHENHGEGVKKGIWSEPMGRNRKRNGPCKGHTGLLSQAGNGIVRKNGHFQGSTVCFQEECGTVCSLDRTGPFQGHCTFFSSWKV